MKIDVIVPTNNINQINGFIDSFSKLGFFKYSCELVIIGNGEVTEDKIVSNNLFYSFVRYNKKINDGLVPFAELRNSGMLNSDSDYFLFMDDDHRFEGGADCYLMECLHRLENYNCSVLCTDRDRDGKKGLHLKLDGFIWTNRGLFIKNVGIDFSKFKTLLGAGEDLLFSYYTLKKEGLPYIFYGSKITRIEKRFINGKKKRNPSYTKKVMHNNCIGHIRKEFDDRNWIHESDDKCINYPNKLQVKINERINESFVNNTNK